MFVPGIISDHILPFWFTCLFRIIEGEFTHEFRKLLPVTNFEKEWSLDVYFGMIVNILIIINMKKKLIINIGMIVNMMKRSKYTRIKLEANGIICTQWKKSFENSNSMSFVAESLNYYITS